MTARATLRIRVKRGEMLEVSFDLQATAWGPALWEAAAQLEQYAEEWAPQGRPTIFAPKEPER